MDDSGKGLYSSSAATIRPSANPKFSITVSAASKASAERKKILVDRNEALNSTETHHNNTTNLDSKLSPLCSAGSSVSNRLIPALSRGSMFGDDEQNTCASDSSLAYDPLTNYLSPRPKFLRYKPNRHREIFLGDENEIGKENVKSSVHFDFQRVFVKQEDGKNVTGNEQDEGSVVKSSASLASQRNNSKEEEVRSSQEGIVEDDSDEESEEFEEENYSVLKKVMKFLLVIGSLFLSTIYICSMNSPSPSLTPQASDHVNDGYHQFQNQTSEVGDFLEGRLLSWIQTEGIEFTSSIGFDDEAKAEGNSNGLVESADELGEVIFSLKQNAESEEVLDFIQSKGIELSETTEMSDNEQVEVEDKAETIEEFLYDEVEKEVVEVKMEERVEEGLTQNADGFPKEEVDLVKELLLVLVTAALSLLGFCFWQKKNSLSVEKPLSESILEVKTTSICPEEKTTSICPAGLPDLEEEHIEKVKSFLNSSSLLCSKEEKLCQIRAPTVELLGEFVVGGEVSSSIKSCGMQSKLMEIEVCSSSGFQQKGNHAKYVFSNPVKPSASEFSTMNSPSYGSFTAEKKISKKELGKGGEVKSAAVTPLRRSSRLHGRAVMSP